MHTRLTLHSAEQSRIGALESKEPSGGTDKGAIAGEVEGEGWGGEGMLVMAIG
jgi:hypothetical protein